MTVSGRSSRRCCQSQDQHAGVVIHSGGEIVPLADEAESITTRSSAFRSRHALPQRFRILLRLGVLPPHSQAALVLLKGATQGVARLFLPHFLRRNIFLAFLRVWTLLSSASSCFSTSFARARPSVVLPPPRATRRQAGLANLLALPLSQQPPWHSWRGRFVVWLACRARQVLGRHGHKYR